MAAGTSCSIFILSLFLWCCFLPEIYSRRAQHCWSNFKIHGSKSPPRQPCFDNKCRCDETTVDCSFSNLPYIPRVKRSVEFLNMSNNNLKRIVHHDFFVNASRNVSVLDLYNNGLTQIEPGVFKYMVKLKRVFMGGNKLTYEHISPVLNVPRLRSLELNCGLLGNVPENFFANHSCPELRYIDMSWNAIQHLDMEQFQPLHQLSTLFLRDNQIASITPAYHPYLRVWVMHNNTLFKFPTTCDGNRMSLYPNLTVLDLNFNYISDLPNPICLPSLTKLSLNYNSFAYFSQNMFSLQTFPMLRQLSLAQMGVKILNIEGFTFNNSNLTDIEFGLNSIDFSSDSVSKDVFQGCHRLKKLHLDRNNFDDVDPERFQSLFEPVIPSLEVLYLGKAHLKLREDTFQNWTHLKQLYLYDNGLRSIPDRIVDHLENLTILKLGSNQITTVPESAFSVDTRNRIKKIDLSGNPFSCTCEIRLLQQWMKTQPARFLNHRRKRYLCSNLENKTVDIRDFDLPDQACLLDPSTSILISGFIIIFIIFLLFIMACWMCHWHFYFWFHKFPRQDVVQRAQRGHYLFHIFVVYDEDDSRWVHDTLRPMLEETWGLKVCIHARDFDPRRQDLANIDEYLPSSHTILVVFSPSFARDRQRQFELGLCYEQAMRTRCTLVPVLLPGWRAHITEDMVTVLRLANMRLEWKEEAEDPEGHRFFWRILHQVLRGVILLANKDQQKKRQ